jgi:hypothetical protein
MYKKQLRFQKFACLFAIIAAAVSFVYALGIMTDLYDSLYATMMNPNDLTQTSVPGSIIYYDMQPFNKSFVNASIVLILTAAFLFVSNTNIRRKYYISNYIATAVHAVATVGVAVWSHLQISAFKVQYLTTVDFEALKAFSELWGKPYIESTFWFDVHFFVSGLAIVSAAVLVYNLIWKVRMMREENALLEGGKEVAA